MELEILKQLAQEISQKTFLEAKKHPVTSLNSIRMPNSCNQCCILKSVCDDLHEKIEEITNQYNNLLSMSNSLINYSSSILEQTRAQYQEISKEIQQYKNILSQQQKQHDSVIKLKEKESDSLKYIIYQKEQIIEELYDNNQKQINKENDMSLQNRQLRGVCQKLAHHRRQRSTLCLKLQNQNEKLMHQINKLEGQNSKMLYQNQKLQENIRCLKDYIDKIEQDLISNNITSPKMLGATYQHNEPDDLQDEQKNNSIEDQSQIGQRTFIYQGTDYGKTEGSLGSFIGTGNGNALREIMNISAQTSKYFNFARQFPQGFKQKTFQNQSAGQGFFDSQEQVSKQIQVNKENLCNVNEFSYQNKPASSKKNKNAYLDITIDPYYAFYTMTVQCAKLNWGNLEEVANIDLADYWQIILDKGIPYNKWHDHIQEVLRQKCKIRK